MFKSIIHWTYQLRESVEKITNLIRKCKLRCHKIYFTFETKSLVIKLWNMTKNYPVNLDYKFILMG